MVDFSIDIETSITHTREAGWSVQQEAEPSM